MTSPSSVLLSDLKLKIFAASYRHGPRPPVYASITVQPTVVTYLKVPDHTVRQKLELRRIFLFSKIQLVVYYQCCVLIG